MTQEEPRVVDNGVPTLHVYTNLVQVPTLVLTMTNDPVGKPIVESRFSVSIDSGRWFVRPMCGRKGTIQSHCRFCWM
jgi:hypothetical protein